MKKIYKIYMVYDLQKIKDQIEFGFSTKKRQTTLDAYFKKDLN